MARVAREMRDNSRGPPYSRRVHPPEATPPQDPHGLLEKRFSDLGLSLAGAPVEKQIQRLRRELERKGIRAWRPSFYLTDEWGCPFGQPIIGVPYYLADARVAELEKQMNDLESPAETMMYLRHETGHAYNYAYRLYVTPEWRDLFGSFRRPYRDHYRPKPFSKSYVRHIAGWYAQKHPDEDFAETFAVWLTPGSRWRVRYRGWPALKKLLYVDATVRRLRDVEPARRRGQPDLTVDDMEFTLAEFYRQQTAANAAAVEVEMHADLPAIFRARRRRAGVRPAADLVLAHRELLTDKIEYWSGVRRAVIRGLLESMVRQCRELKLYASTDKEPQYLVELAAYATTLAMNYLTRGRFEQT
jgi:hypothetical protein